MSIHLVFVRIGLDELAFNPTLALPGNVGLSMLG